LFEAFSELHGRGACKVAMRRHFWGFKCGFVTGTGGKLFKPGTEVREQIIFYREHGGILRSPCFSAASSDLPP
jgi:hypothetical protein